MLLKILLLATSVAFLAILATNTTTTLPLRILNVFYSTLSFSPYQAPLDDCIGTLVPGGYMVKLQPGHSLKDHSAAIGTEIKPHLESMREDNKFYGLVSIFYVARDIDEELLASIRADRGVYRVACDQMSLPDFGIEVYRAPLRGCKKSVVSQDYIVRLIPGHSLKDHSKAINTDIESQLLSTRIYDQHSSIAYWARDINKEMLATIRADTGVFYVECNRGGYPVDRDIGMASTRTSSSIPYEAPLDGCKETVTPGEYAVSLYPGHSVKNHFAVIGHDIYLTSHNDLFFHGSTVYWAKDIEEDILIAIRSDPGVHSVSCDGPGPLGD
jgi:hypothetical protein